MLFDHGDFVRLAQVRLLENEDNVLEPFFVNEAEQLPGRGAPRIHDREDEKHQVGARDKIFRDRLVLGHHRVGAGRIDDVEVFEKGDRLIPLGNLRGHIDALLARAVFENVNPIRCRQNVDLAELLPKKRVEE